jgi:putative ABC transport system permease protein
MRLFRLAFRNLLRARRRSTLAVATMLLGCAALVAAQGLADGIASQLTSSLVAVQTGHLQVVARPLDFEPQNSPFDAYGETAFAGASQLAERIEKEAATAGVVKATPYLATRGTVVSGNRSSPVVVIGIVPGREDELRRTQAPLDGTFLPEGDDQAAYLAVPLARKLRISVGDSVSFVVQTAHGAVNSLDATVCGIFDKGAPWYDNTAYVSLGAARTLVDKADAATNVKIMLRNDSARARLGARDAVVSLIGQTPDLPAGQGLRVETVEQAGRFSFSILEANQSAINVLSTFLFLAAAVGVVNAMLASVHERTREIGTIRALGMRRSAVVRLFVLEGAALGIVSAALGVLVGGALVLHWGSAGIPMNTMTLAWMAGGDRLYPLLRPGSVAFAAAVIVVLSSLAAVYPAFAASRLEPREALHHV